MAGELAKRNAGALTYQPGDIRSIGARPNIDCTEKLQYALDNWNVILIPIGNFIYSGNLHFNRPGITIKGENEYSSILTNTSNTDCFIVGTNVEFINIHDLSFRGNYAKGNAEASSTKRCFAFGLNSVMWNFDRVFFSGFYDYFLDGGGNGHINDMHITRCEFRTGHKSAIHFVAKNYQVNAIYITDNNIITGFEGNGLDLWGNNIIVENNAIQACDNFAISLNSMDHPNVFMHCAAPVIRGNYYELCYKGFIDIAECQGTGIDEYATYSGYKYVYDLELSHNFGDISYPSGATQEQKDLLDTYGVVNFRSNNKVSSPCQGIHYKANKFDLGTTTNKYIVNTHGLLVKTEYISQHSFIFTSYNPKNIDNIYTGLKVSPAKVYKKLVPFGLTYDLINDSYRVDNLVNGYNYIYFNKDDFGHNDGAIELYLKTDAVKSDICFRGFISYKLTEDVEDFTPFGEITGSNIYGQIEGETPVFHKLSIPIWSSYWSGNVVNAVRRRFRLGLYLPTANGATYFEIKDVKIKCIE